MEKLKNEIIIWSGLDPERSSRLKNIVKKEDSPSCKQAFKLTSYLLNFTMFKILKDTLIDKRIGQPIIVIKEKYYLTDEDKNTRDIQIIESGELSRCFKEHVLSKYYINRKGNFCAVYVNLDNVCFCTFKTIKKNTPLTLIHRLFSNVKNDYMFIKTVDEITESIADEVLNALAVDLSDIDVFYEEQP